MLQNKFLANKIKRQINTNGQTFNFKRYVIDQYHQVSDEIESEFSIKGLFHTTNSFIKQEAKDATKFTSKPQPMILCLSEDGNNVKINDEVMIRNDIYVVTNINDVNDFGIVYDISLELKK